MKITSAVFDVSAPDFASCPPETLPEFALIGRSNVGKSTLLNRLAEKRDLARVSDTPGFTKTLNFYTINRRWRLVDLPGYGFAKTSQTERARYTKLIEDYLLNRGSLACVLVLVDSSIPPQPADLDFVDWIGRADRPFALVFTKEDKAKGNKALEHVEQFMSAVSEWFEEPPLMFVTSAKSQTGVRELQETIVQAASSPTASEQDQR
jgi:GTP-binding protein